MHQYVFVLWRASDVHSPWQVFVKCGVPQACESSHNNNKDNIYAFCRRIRCKKEINCAERLLTERREIAMNWSEWQLLVIIDGALFSCKLFGLSQNSYIHLSKEIIVFQIIILFVLMFCVVGANSTNSKCKLTMNYKLKMYINAQMQWLEIFS